jgi:hypothetical protein
MCYATTGGEETGSGHPLGAEVLGINVFDTHKDLYQRFVQINSFDTKRASTDIKRLARRRCRANIGNTENDPASPLKGYRRPDQRKPVESQGTQAMMMTAIKRANM